MAGHIFERLDTVKEYRSLKTSQNKKKWTELRKLYSKLYEHAKINLNKKELSEKEIKLIKEKIRKKIITERIIKNIFVSMITLIIAILILYFLNIKLW